MLADVSSCCLVGFLMVFVIVYLIIYLFLNFITLLIIWFLFLGVLGGGWGFRFWVVLGWKFRGFPGCTFSGFSLFCGDFVTDRG